jgi:hypothetical protein
MQPLRRSVGRSIGCLLALLLLFAGLGIGGYLFLSSSLITVAPQPRIVLNCSNDITIVAGDSATTVKTARPLDALQSHSYKPETNTLTFDACDSLSLEVPTSSNLKLDTNGSPITVIGVTGQLTIGNNGGSINLINCNLVGQSTIDNNGGPIRFNGTIAREGTYRLSANGGTIDITLPSETPLSLDIPDLGNTLFVSDFPGIAVQNSNSGPTVHARLGQAPYATLEVGSNDPVVLKRS